MATFTFNGHEYKDTGKYFFEDGKRISAKAYNAVVEEAVQAKKEAKANKETKPAKPAKSTESKETKVRKPRKKKDVAFEHGEYTLTAKQVSFLRHLAEMVEFAESMWIDEIVDGIGGEFSGKPMTVGAMVSTICEKNLAFRAKEKRERKTCTYIEFNENGIAVLTAMGLRK